MESKKRNTFISKVYSNNFLGLLLHNLVYCLKSELKNCNSVLDLGCGPSSPLQYCKNIKYSVGVEVFKEYLEKSKKNKIHSRYINSSIQKLHLDKDSFDAVIMIETLEHLKKTEGRHVLDNIEKWANKKIIITTPNKYWPQVNLDKNRYQKHLSGWNVSEFTERGYRVYGLSGLKLLRKETESNSMDGDMLSSIKYSPKIFWFAVAALSQLFVYYIPSLAFELLCVKDLKNEN